jgi:GTP-binding protein
MKIQHAEFQISAQDLETCPYSTLPEFAFIGRSNVGKSSLINMLTGQKGLAKVSATPGHTRLINFFLINKKWHIVDLPGYGFAKVHKEERDGFHDRIEQYIAGREGLTCVMVIIDASIPPQKNDLTFVEWLVHSRISFSLIYNKSDKGKKEKIQFHIQAFEQAMKLFSNGKPNTFLVSAKDGFGGGKIIDFMRGFC